MRLYPPVSFADHAFHACRLRGHAPHLPRPAGADGALLAALRRDGLAEGPAAGIGGLDAEGLLAACAALADCWQAADRPGPALAPPRPPHGLIARFPGLYCQGLDPALLDLAEAYIGLPPLYHGYDLKQEPADGRMAGTRLWHRDVEDHRVLKLLVYLEPVDADRGPFAWLPEPASREAGRRLRYRHGYVGDAAMAAVAPAGAERRATGGRGHAVLFDGARLFHRAGVPHGGPRLSITFNWSSRRPIRRFSPGPGPALRAAIMERLDDRQRACLIG